MRESTSFGRLRALNEEHFRRHLDTHVLGLILASQPAAKHFDSSGGSIINIGF
jgi:3-oxoacyl-[acyl-carrier protein] reductase